MNIKYENGKIYSGEGFIDSFTVDTESGLFTEAAADKVVDLGGKFVSAGFIDSHMHILNYGNMLSMARLADNTSSKKATSLKAKKKAEMVFDTKHLKSRWYKIKLTKKQVVRITTNPRFYAFQLFNSKLKEVPIYEGENWVYSTKKKLAKGTYYIKAKGEASSDCGLYQCFSWK